MPVTTAELAAALIAVIEGSRLKSYQDPGGVWTIGIGHTKGVTEGMTITPSQQAEFFAQDAAPLLATLETYSVLEGAALASFGFNCGAGALRLVMSGHDLISSKVHTTDRHGNVLPGLQARRNLEELLCALSQQLQVRGAGQSGQNP